MCFYIFFSTHLNLLVHEFVRDLPPSSAVTLAHSFETKEKCTEKANKSFISFWDTLRQLCMMK